MGYPRCIAVGLLILLAEDVRGQTCAECDARQDFSDLTMKVGGTNVTVPGSKSGAYYNFTMNYEYGVVSYIATEFRKNTSVIHLNNWCSHKTTRNLDVADLTDSSRTENILLATGDLLSFYREFGWYDPVNSTRTPNGYYAEDSLDYAVELVHAATGARLALLDSFGVLKKVPAGYPSLHGTRPIFAKVEYIVPPPYNGMTAFIRVRLYSRGNGPYYFVRRDGVSTDLSGRLNDAEIISHVASFGGGLKPVVQGSSIVEKSDAVKTFTVFPNPATSGVEISVELTLSDDPVTVAIYDAAGSLVFMPVLGYVGSDIRVHHDFESAGWYTVVVYRDGVPVASRAVQILN